MSDPLRTDSSRALDAASDADRDAKIEQLLLVGLDHYFAAQYEQAINVWTRALFLDRSHARARAYIERARSAVAERQRESEELLQRGVAAFEQGDADAERQLLVTAIGRGGAPSDEALAVLDRLNRLERDPIVQASTAAAPADRVSSGTEDAHGTTRSTLRAIAWAAMLILAVAGGLLAVARPEWRALRLLESLPSSVPAAPLATESGLPLPTRGEGLLVRARALQAGGHLRDALVTLESVRLTDAQKAEADRLRGVIQRQLVELASATGAPAPPEKIDDRVP
jgi:tetratricopeptide (TPR) repeat protein